MDLRNKIIKTIFETLSFIINTIINIFKIILNMISNICFMNIIINGVKYTYIFGYYIKPNRSSYFKLFINNFYKIVSKTGETYYVSDTDIKDCKNIYKIERIETPYIIKKINNIIVNDFNTYMLELEKHIDHPLIIIIKPMYMAAMNSIGVLHEEY